MVARVIAGVVGLFYLVTGAWSFMFPAHFYSAVATFSPYNLHLLHDVGAFQFGLGAALVAATISRRGLMPALAGVLAGSFLHVLAHLFDIRLGGHPATDLPFLALIVILLATALYLELRRPHAASHL